MITQKLLKQTLQEWSDTLSVDGHSGDTVITTEALDRLSEKLIVIMHRIISRRKAHNRFVQTITNLKTKISNRFVHHNLLHLLLSINLLSIFNQFTLRSFSVGGLS